MRVYAGPLGAIVGLRYRLGQPELLLRNEYLAPENRILRSKLAARIRLINAERAKLVEIGERLGRKALKEVASVAKWKQSLDSIGSWSRRKTRRIEKALTLEIRARRRQVEDARLPKVQQESTSFYRLAASH